MKLRATRISRTWRCSVALLRVLADWRALGWRTRVDEDGALVAITGRSFHAAIVLKRVRRPR